MSYSTTDELADIERAARVGGGGGGSAAPSRSAKPKPPAPKVVPSAAASDPRRGSSIFSGANAMNPNTYKVSNGSSSGNNPVGNSHADEDGDDLLLVDFPRNDSSSRGKPNAQTNQSNPNSSGRSAPPPSKSGVKKSTSSSKPKTPKIDLNSMVIPAFGGSRGGAAGSSQSSRPPNKQPSHRPPGTGFREKHGDMEGMNQQMSPPKQPGPGSKEYRPLVGGFAAAAYEAARADHYAHVDAKKGKVKRKGPLPSI